MSDKPITFTDTPEGNTHWLADLQTRIQNAHQRA
jgi:hypothetical protein